MLEKITEQELTESGVVSAPDKLTGDPAENKRLFDRLITAVLAPHVNRVIQALNDLEAALQDHIDIDPASVRDNNVSVTEAVKAALGLEGVNPTVKDALLGLSPIKPYLEHWWRRRRALTDSPVEIGEETDASGKWGRWYADGSSTEIVVELWSGVEVDKLGLICPTDVERISTTYNEADDVLTDDVLAGKYFLSGRQVYLIPEGASLVKYHNTGTHYYIYPSTVCPVTAELPDRAWETMRDTDETAWPKTGEVEGYEYEYLGVPVEGTPSAARMICDVYCGTGEYGAEHMNRVSLPFIPKMAVITPEGAPGSFAAQIVAVHGAEEAVCCMADGIHKVPLEWDGNDLGWHSTESALYQLNQYGARYRIVAFG